MTYRSRLMAAAAVVLACAGAAALPLSPAQSAAPAATAAAAGATNPNGRPPGLDFLSMSPDGKHLAFVNPAPYAVVIIDADARINTALPVNGTRITALSWLDDTHVLTVRTGYQAVGDLLPSQLLHQAVIYGLVDKKLRVPLKELDTTAAVLADGGLVAGVWHDKPSLFLTAWGVGGGEPDKSLFRFDMESGRSALFDKGSFDSGEWVITPAGELLAKTTYNPASDKWTLFGRFANQWKTIKAESSPQPMILVGQGRTPDTVALTTTDDLVELSLTDGSVAPLGPPNAIVERGLFDRATGRLIGMKLAGEPPSYVFFDAQLNATWGKTLRAFKGKRVKLLDFSADRKTLAVDVNADGGPADAYLIDVAAGRANMLGPEHPDLRPEQVGKVVKVDFTSRDGLALDGYLTLPPGREGRNLPLLVLIGDRPDSSASLDFDGEAQVFASAGYAVFRPNARGAASSTRTLRDGGLGQLGKAMQTDIVDGVEHLAATGVVDRKRVCIMGEVYGAFAAAAAVTVQKQPWRCAIGFSGDYDLGFYAQEDEQLVRGTGWKVRSIWRRYIAGSAKPTRDQVSVIAPATHAADATAPILMIVRDGDQGARERAARLHGALDAAGKPNSVLVLKKTTSLVDPADQDKLWAAELDFLTKTNPPG